MYDKRVDVVWSYWYALVNMLLSCLLGLTCWLVACSFAPPLSPLPPPPPLPLSTDSIGSVGVHGESVVTAILNNCSNMHMHVYVCTERAVKHALPTVCSSRKDLTVFGISVLVHGVILQLVVGSCPC